MGRFVQVGIGYRMSIPASVLIFAVVCVSTAVSAAPGDAAHKCFGKAATLVAEPSGTVIGTFGDDVIVGSEGADTLLGMEGNDLICGRGGDDVVYGGADDDRLTGNSGSNELHGEDGNDTCSSATLRTSCEQQNRARVVENCIVSDILVPSCGAWLGASTPSLDGRFDYRVGLDEYESVAQNTPDILHFYKAGRESFPTDGEIAQAERADKQRSLLSYNWKPGGRGSDKVSWAEIANGAVDDDIAFVAQNIKAYERKLFLTIFHEPEDDVDKVEGSGYTLFDYRDMFRHVVARLRAEGAGNAVFVWNLIGNYGNADLIPGLWPGNDVVDWIAYDPYITKEGVEDISELLNFSLDPAWPGFYDWAIEKAPGKPIMLGEWGVTMRSGVIADPASRLDVDPAALFARYPQIKAYVYWNDIGVGNYRIDDNSVSGNPAYGSAYREFARHPIFNTIDPSTAP